MGNGTESETLVENQAPAVAQETGDSRRAPPIRVFNNGESSNPVVINNKEYPLSSTPENPPPTINSHNRALGEPNQEFCDWNLPLPRSGDTTALSEAEHPHALNAIASCSEPVALDLGEDLPNQVANPDRVGLEEKEKSLDLVRKELRDPVVLDAVCRLINLRHVDLSFRELAAVPLGKLGKQCGGGKGGGGGSNSKGSQTESSSSQGGHGTFVTGYTGSGLGNNIVTGLGRGCGGGGGGGDDDPFNYRPPETLSGHYADFVGFEEPPNNDAQRDAAMGMLSTMSDNPMLPQFNQNREELLSCNLEGVEGMDFEPSDTFFEDLLESALHIEPTEETIASSLPSNPPVSEETQSDIGHAFDLIHLMSKPAQRSSLQGPMVGITPMAKSIPHSQIPGNNTTAYLPLSSPSPATPYSAPTPSPMQPASLPPPPTPVTPSPLPQTPSTPQPCGFFKPNSFIEGENRVCELVIPSNIPQEKRNTPIMALYYAASQYQKIMECMEKSFDLKIASDIRAKMCAFEFHPEECKMAFTMPKDCKPLSQWLSPAVELKDRLLILQQVINTLATVHTLGHEEDLSLWGSFMVWVAPDMRVHLLVDFPLLFKKQQEFACSGQQGHPRRCDILEVQKIYQKLISPYIGQNESWVSPGLSSILHSFQYLLSDVSSGCRMAEAARTLGERRICRIDVEMINLPIVIYCMERESLQSALEPLVPMVPRSIAHVWVVQSIHSRGQFIMRAGDVATADRKMQLVLVPCMHPSDPGALYIKLNDVI